MKLIGYVRSKGEYNGKPYDNYKLFIEEEQVPISHDVGGSQILIIEAFGKKDLPKLKHDEFVTMVQNGLKIGSELEVFRDMKNRTVIKMV